MCRVLGLTNSPMKIRVKEKDQKTVFPIVLGNGASAGNDFGSSHGSNGIKERNIESRGGRDMGKKGMKTMINI